jgi:hypothetical protein
MKYIVWQRLPKAMLCGYRDTKQEAEEYVKQLTRKNINAIFDIRCVNKQGEAK